MIPSTPSAVDPKTINPTILTGGATAVDFSTDGLNDDIWDSPAAADYQAGITKAIGDADTALSTIIDCLAAAENHQIYYVGERVTPDQPEAVWDLGEIMQWAFSHRDSCWSVMMTRIMGRKVKDARRTPFRVAGPRRP